MHYLCTQKSVLYCYTKNITIMKKRFYQERVCSCSPVEGMTFMESKMLKELVYREIHNIHCTTSSNQKGLKGLNLGNLCAEANHLLWALLVWWFTINEVHNKDYNDKNGKDLDTRHLRLRYLTSISLCEMIGRRIDEVSRSLSSDETKGHSCFEYTCGEEWYKSFRYEKRNNDADYWENYFTRMKDGAYTQHVTRIF